MDGMENAYLGETGLPSEKEATIGAGTPEAEAPEAYSVTEALLYGGLFNLFRAKRNRDGLPVIIKALQPNYRFQVLEQIKHEFEIGKALDVSAAVKPLALQSWQGMPALITEDFGGTSLDKFMGVPMETGRFLKLAVRMAAAVSAIHRKNFVHKDIKPANVIVNPATDEIKLTDFSVASALPCPKPSTGSIRLIEGSLPYMSPEQTGRTNQAPDQRSDLYSLGVTFYEMLTGRLPFQAADPLEWVYCHIARPATPPADLLPSIPGVISLIISKLLAKEPDQRYQSAHGLQDDLEKCLSRWESGKSIPPFPLAEKDIPDRLQIPHKLYGREEEISILNGTFERVIRTGVPEMALVSGYSGIGKTSLIRELQKPMSRERGFFASGKFDRLKRDIPYSTMVEAFTELVFEILTGTAESVAQWKRELHDALGINARLIVDVIPLVESVIGPQPPVSALSPTESQNRFRRVFRRFIGVFARKSHPLALFLDDLQWADSASLSLIRELMTDTETHYLFFIGAFRDNEVTPSHPLMVALDGMRILGVPMTDVVLGPLSTYHLRSFLADTLRYHPKQVAPLADLIAEKTAGNPFFATRFLMALYDARLIELDIDTGTWSWDIEKIRARNFTDNVVELLLDKLNQLSPDVRNALKQIACLGAVADTDIIAMVLDCPREDVGAKLSPAVGAGLIQRKAGGFGFVHDRVLDAAYSLIDKGQQTPMHLRIGRIFLARMDRDAVEERVFDVVNQLNKGLPLVTEEAEKEAIRKLDLLAGRKAKASVAYASARTYLNTAADLLPSEAAWESMYGDAFAIHLGLAECEYLLGDFEKADARFDLILRNSRSRLDRIKVYILRLRLYQVSGKYDAAMALSLEALRLFDVSCPETEEGIQAEVMAEVEDIGRNLGGRRISDLVDAPVATDPDLRAIIGLLVEAIPCAYIAQPRLFPWIVVKALNCSLRHGNTEESCFAYSTYGIVLVGAFGEIPPAFEFSEMAIRLNEKFKDPRLKGTLLFIHGAFINAWRRPIATNLPIMEQSFLACLEAGDLVYAGYNGCHMVWHVIDKGGSKEEVRKICSRYTAFARQSHNDVVFRTIRQYEQFLLCLEGATRGPTSFDSDSFSESESLEMFEKARFGPAIGFHHILKQASSFIYGEYDAALQSATEAQKVLRAVMVNVIESAHHLFYGLTLTALYGRAGPERREEILRILDEKLAKFRLWADNCPENFQCRYSLLAAEAARIAGRDLEAMRLYDAAIKDAGENGFIHIEALANELAAHFYADRERSKVAETYMREAIAAYARWEADGKVKQLEKQNPNLRKRRPMLPSFTLAFGTERIDVIPIVRASQAISGQIFMDKLLETLIRVAMEQAGAQRGYVVLSGEGALSLEAEAAMDEKGALRVKLLASLPAAGSPLLPGAILNVVSRTKKSLVLEDASSAPLFASDDYIARNKPRSVLCLPIIRQTEFIGLLYLENNLVTGAFTPDQQEVLELIVSQAAISLENSRLYNHLARENEERKLAEERFTKVFHASPSPLGVLNLKDMSFTDINESGCRVMGFSTREEVLGRTPVELGVITEVQLKGLSDAMAADGKVRNKEFRIRTPSGEPRVVLTSFERIELGGEPCALASGMDITERTRAEEERERLMAQLAEERTRLSTILNLMPVPMLLLEPDTAKTLFANKAAHDLAGGAFPRCKAVHGGKTVLLCSDVNGEPISEGEFPVDRAARGEKIVDFEMNWQSPKGMRMLLINSEMLRDPEGHARTAVLAFQDLTPFKDVEAQLRQSQKMEALGRLSGGIAHDFNNLLTAINGYSSIALEMLDENHPVHGFLKEIMKSGERASALTRQLLAYSRKQLLDPKPWSLNAIIGEMEPMLKRLIGEDVGLTVRLTKKSGLVRVDRGQVEQILLNLVINSRDAMPKGGTLTLETANATLDANYQSSHPDAVPGRYMMLAVSDTGTGMSPEVETRIFEPFFTTKDVGKGTGLGLAVVYGIVKQSGGSISVSSEMGKGTTFRIYLPLAAEPAGTEPEPDGEEFGGVHIQTRVEYFPGSETILLVEDEPSVRKFATLTLQSQGYKVYQAGNGREALKVLEDLDFSVHLVITDVVMPEMGGRELAGIIGAKAPSIPILFISGYTGQSIVSEGMPGPEDNFLPKPFGPSDLAKRVRTMLDRKSEIHHSSH